MAEHREADSDDWGNKVARHTFLYTVIGALLFAAVVFIFILSR
jgi:hypothetical protein